MTLYLTLPALLIVAAIVVYAYLTFDPYTLRDEHLWPPTGRLMPRDLYGLVAVTNTGLVSQRGVDLPLADSEEWTLGDALEYLADVETLG